jgi:hypothetical protein
MGCTNPDCVEGWLGDSEDLKWYHTRWDLSCLVTFGDLVDTVERLEELEGIVTAIRREVR